MRGIMGAIASLWGFLKGSQFFWNLLRNYGTIKKSLEDVSKIFNEMKNQENKTPNCEQAQVLLKSLSTLLKTGVIDIPGINEYEISMSIDDVSANLVCMITDKKLGKIVNIPVKGIKNV
jgi:hypothetical protein